MKIKRKTVLWCRFCSVRAAFPAPLEFTSWSGSRCCRVKVNGQVTFLQVIHPQSVSINSAQRDRNFTWGKDAETLIRKKITPKWVFDFNHHVVVAVSRKFINSKLSVKKLFLFFAGGRFLPQYIHDLNPKPTLFASVSPVSWKTFKYDSGC